MVVCQFFLNGTCKFGNRCHNEHTYPANSGRFVGRPTLGQSLNDRYHFTAVNNNKSFGNQAKTNTNFQVDQNAILQALRKELQEWDTNKVWPLSCFAAQREQKCLPGLDDTSPEELRLEAYKYQGTGNFQTYVNGVSTLSNQVMNRRNQLKTMSNDQLLKELQSSSNVAVSSPSTSLFGSSTLGNSNNLFGGGGFGNSSQSQTTSTTSSIFGSASQSGGLFSGGTTSTLSNPFISSNSGGLFMNTNAVPTVNIGSNTGVSGNPFLSNPSVAPGGLFSSNTSNITAPTSTQSNILPTPFGNTVSNVSNPFGVSTSVSSSGALFSQLKPSGLFGTSSPTQPATCVSTATANPFFSPPATIQSPIQQLKPPVVTSNPTLFISKLPQVTPADIEKFNAAKFVLGHIPTCPPPIELC